MVKRDFAANPDIDVDAPRSKRRKDTQSEAPAAEDSEMPEAGVSSDQEQESGVAGDGPAMSPEEVQEEGHKVLQVLKDAVDKDGRSLSYDFLRLPSKRQFPDYYLVIKRPIALDDIKTQLDNYAYPSLEAVRQDFEQCFKNAKKYNMRESVIWKDAKALQKIANKEIEKIVRRRTDDDDADGEAGSDKEGGRKKEKGVNINRLMKNRLQKLTSKTDVNGRLIAADFMDLPSKKKWAVYYKIIKRPICIEDIFKRIKRKEYPTIPDFISDVDLVFANAMQFNEEHSPIWEDAVELKVYFHQLMTDLPAKYNMNGAGDVDPTASPEVASNKILLKLPHPQAAAHAQSGTDEGLQNTDTPGGTVRLRVPALGGSSSSGIVASGEDKAANLPADGVNEPATRKHKTKSPAVTPAALPAQMASSSSAPALAMPTPRPAKLSAPAHMKQPLANHVSSFTGTPPVTTAPYQYSSSHVAPQNFYSPSVPPTTAPAPIATPARASATPGPSFSGTGVVTMAGIMSASQAPTPTPPASAAGLHSLRLEMQPAGRRVALDAGAGVRNWAVRLGAEERNLFVRGVRFLRDGEEGEDGEGSDDELVDDASAEAPPPKKRGRGRPRKSVTAKGTPVKAAAPTAASASSTTPSSKQKEVQKPKHALPSVPAIEDVLVRLDGLVITPKTPKDNPVAANGDADADAESSKQKSEQSEAEWPVDVATGRHVLEVGRKGNSVLWRVYVYA